MLREFKAFAFKGNLIDLAVGFILGATTTAVISSLVDDIIMPVIGAVVGDESFSDLTLEISGAHIRYGNFINRLVYLVIVAWVLFLAVRAINRIERPFQDDPASTTKECPFCFSSIPRLARRCPNCTSDLAEGATPAPGMR